MALRFARFVIRWRYAIIVLTLLFSALALSGIRLLEFTNDYRVYFGKDNPQLAAFEKLQDIYTKNDNVFFMLAPRDAQVFTRDTLAAAAELTAAGWQIPYSTRVDSITNFQYSHAEGDELVVRDLVPETTDLSQDRLREIEAVALTEPLLLHRLVSAPAHVTGVNVTVELPGEGLHEVREVADHARDLVRDMRTRYPHIDFYLTGIVMLNNAFPEASQTDMKSLVPPAFAAILVTLWLFLRSVFATLATVLVIILSIVLAMGTTGWLGIKLTSPSATAPIIILTLAVADCVHFLITFLLNLRRGHPRHEAIVESLRINLHPIFLTSLTTAIGFLSLNFSDSPPFNDLGNITAMGVGYAFVLSVLFLPALAAVAPVQVKQRTTRASQFMEHLAQFVIRRRRGLLWGLGIIAAVLIAFVPRNELNDVFVHYFDDSIEFRRHSDIIAEHLAGLYSVNYSLDTGESGAISDPEYLREVDVFANWLRQQPEVVHVNVITDTLRRLNKNMHGDDPAHYALPAQRELAAQYLLLYEMSLPYGLDLNNQINVDKSATRIGVSLRTLSTNEVLALEERIASWLQTNAPELISEGASPSIMFAHISQRNIRSMLFGTTLALLLISGILILALRSLKLGLISLVPNLYPVAIAFGLWGLLVGEIGLSLSVVAGMTLGIVVDDTVHFLSKYTRARREQGLSSEDAVRYAFTTVGRALWVTTLALTGGFLVLSLSAFELNAGMGLLTAMTIAIALVVDFLLLPPMLMRFDHGV